MLVGAVNRRVDRRGNYSEIEGVEWGLFFAGRGKRGGPHL